MANSLCLFFFFFEKKVCLSIDYLENKYMMSVGNSFFVPFNFIQVLNFFFFNHLSLNPKITT